MRKNIINYIKNILFNKLSSLYFHCKLLFLYFSSKNKFHIYSIEDTIKKIKNDKCSMIRFGDGELSIILGKSIGFQEYNENLAKKLTNIIQSNEEKLLICIPDIFEGLCKYNKESRLIWLDHLANNRKEWEKICINENYYNAFVSRPYIGVIDKNVSKNNFLKIMEIWENENIIVVEGKFSRLGCGNDLFNNVKSLKRILCPEINAYSKYEYIINEIVKQDSNYLILLSLGPTAKALAFDLFKKGYRTLDIGHLDIEYEWYLRRAKEKIIIPDKYVYEVQGGDKNLNNFYNEKYEDEIIARII